MTTPTRLTGLARSFVDHARESRPDIDDTDLTQFLHEDVETDIIVRYPATARSTVAEAITDGDWEGFVESEYFALWRDASQRDGLGSATLGDVPADAMPTAYSHLAAFLLEWKADELLSAGE